MRHRLSALCLVVAIAVFSLPLTVGAEGNDTTISGKQELGQQGSGSASGINAEQVRHAAEQGNAEAQFSLGWVYSTGSGVPKDDGKAVEWYRKAAEQGYALAQSNLGVMYVEGRGVPQDNVKAVEWYRKAAEQGNALAQSNLGLMYAKGRGVPKDEGKAAEWFRKAAEQGHARAQFNLGWMYYWGYGVIRRDIEKGCTFWRTAGEQGDTLAINAHKYHCPQ